MSTLLVLWALSSQVGAVVSEDMCTARELPPMNAACPGAIVEPLCVCADPHDETTCDWVLQCIDESGDVTE